jgi:integrase
VVDHRIAAGDGSRRFVRAAATVLLGEEAFQARPVLQAQIGSATCARIGEVLSARWSDIDLVRAVWIKPSHHTKQKRAEHLPLSAPAMALLAEMQNQGATGSPYLFPGKIADRPLQGIKKFWRSLTAMAGLDDYRLHDNRHTHASHLVSSGLSLEVVGRLLGNTNPLTPKRYAHLADDPLRAAAARFGSKVTALREGRKAEIVQLCAKDAGA